MFFNLSDKIMYSWCTPGLAYRYAIFLCSLDVEISSQIAIDQYKDYLVGQLTNKLPSEMEEDCSVTTTRLSIIVKI